MASNFATVTAVFTAVAAKISDETAVINTAATSVKFSSHRSKIAILVQCLSVWNLDLD